MMNVVVIRNDELGQRLAARIVGKLGGVREAEPCLAGRPLTRDELAGLAAKGRPLTEGVAVARRKRVERSVLKAKPKVRAISRRTRRGRRKGR